jgi:hypothetical protein
VDIILAHITELDLRRVTCNEFLDRLQLQNDCPALPCPNVLPHCPSSSAAGTNCKPDQ